MRELKLGSLFDGSGGFPLAGVLNGIEPVWASEIEPFPIRVTKARFPNMKHLGDVTKINGAEIEPVDIITFGSPCQDLSVAGKQLGIHDGQRSNLFFEAIRIIKEMREHDRAIGRADDDVRPRFAVWENVPGAFSSNKGADFQAVLQAFCDIEGSGITVPMPPKGKWNPAGCIVGDGFSVAWRVYDAQHWGVPQRRKRIYLIADFAGERAGEILFERESVRRHSAQGGEAGEGTAEDAERGVGGSGGDFMEAYQHHGYRESDVAGTLTAGQNQTVRGDTPLVCYAIDSISSNSMKSANPNSGFHKETVAKTLQTNSDPTCNQCGNVIVQKCYSIEGHVVDRQTAQNGRGWAEGYAHTLNATDRHAVAYEPGMTANGCGAVCCLNDQGGAVMDVSDKAMTLRAQEHGHQPVVCCGLESGAALCVGNGQLHQTDLGDKAGALNCMHDQQAVITQAKPPRKYIVRRLTPIECARLQGFPDWWCDGADGSDSAQYRLWGNGIALPCAVDVIGRIAKELRRGRK